MTGSGCWRTPDVAILVGEVAILADVVDVPRGAGCARVPSAASSLEREHRDGQPTGKAST